MKINIYKMATEGILFKNVVLQGKTLSEEEVMKRSKSALYSSQIDLDIVTNIAVGAIRSYHLQLREILLEKGIDIGDIE